MDSSCSGNIQTQKFLSDLIKKAGTEKQFDREVFDILNKHIITDDPKPSAIESATCDLSELASKRAEGLNNSGGQH